jgi:hypothetical protein
MGNTGFPSNVADLLVIFAVGCSALAAVTLGIRIAFERRPHRRPSHALPPTPRQTIPRQEIDPSHKSEEDLMRRTELARERLSSLLDGTPSLADRRAQRQR